MTELAKSQMLTQSLYRLIAYVRLQKIEVDYMRSLGCPAYLQELLGKATANNNRLLQQIDNALVTSRNKVAIEIELSDDKVRDIGMIIERLYVLEDDEVAALLKQYQEAIKIEWES